MVSAPRQLRWMAAVAAVASGLVVPPPPRPVTVAEPWLWSAAMTETVSLPRKGPSEFELGLGESMDALRADLPEFMDRELQWTAYTEDMEFRDPSGVAVRGIAAYRRIHGLLRMLRQFVVEDWTIRYKLRYDWAGKTIVVRWNSRWYVKASSAPLHIDAVSSFDVRDADGKIRRHRVDRVMVNGKPLTPPNELGWFAFRQYVLAGAARPCPAPCFLETNNNLLPSRRLLDGPGIGPP